MRIELKNKRSRFFFVLGCLGSFFLLCFFYFAANYDLVLMPAEEPAGEDRYFFKTAGSADPYMTVSPGLSDMLKGPIVSKDDPYLGNGSAEIAITVFSDFTCAFCNSQEKVLKELVSEYKDKVMLVRKDYPENDKSGISFRSAVGGRCALAQGKFWEFHDALYASEPDYLTDNEGEIERIISAAAEKAYLNMNKFKACLADGKAETRVMDNMAEADALGITGIPFIFVNDTRVMGSTNKESLRRIIDEL